MNAFELMEFERHLKQQLQDLQWHYEKAAAPIIEQLMLLRALNPQPVYFLVTPQQIVGFDENGSRLPEIPI